MKELGSKVLKTERLTLRPFRADDAEECYKNWMTDPAVTKYLTWTPHRDIAFTRQKLAGWEEEAKKPDNFNWAIVKEEEVIGSISVVSLDKRTDCADLGYCLCRRFWGQGIMTEALARVRDYLFAECGLFRLEARHAAENVGSGRVQEKCGFVYEGTARKAWKLTETGERCDLVFRAVLREEWEFLTGRETRGE